MSSLNPTLTSRRILIVDDHPLVRRGLTALIDGEPDLSVCAIAATRQEALDAILANRPDVVISDLSLDVDDGLRLVQDIGSAYEDLPVLVLSLHDAPRYSKLALQAGASGYISKRESGEMLLVAVRTVLDGKQYFKSQASLALE